MEIEQAIQDRLVVELTYKGGMRLVEPHVLFVDQASTELVRVWQVDGFSHKGNLPGWRSFHTAGISDIRILRTQFAPSSDREAMLQGLNIARIIASVDQLRNPWEALPCESFILPEDQAMLGPDFIDRAELKLYHVPVPFIGDPRSASIIILGLNPGWRSDTDGTELGAEWMEQKRLALTFKTKVSFWPLTAGFENTSGYLWWHKRLRTLIERVGLDTVQERVACIEWFPYHSAKFTRPPAVLPSQRYGFELLRAAIDRGASIIVMRSRSLWEESVPELVNAGPLQLRNPRAAYLTSANLSVDDFERLATGLLAT